MGLIDRVGPLRDGPDHADVVHLLQGAAPQVAEGPLAANHENGRVGTPRVGDPGHAVGDTGARRDGGDADLSRVAARPGVGGVDGGLLVPHIDDLDALFGAPVVERHDVAAGEREDALHAGFLESAGGELSAVDGGHGDTSVRSESTDGITHPDRWSTFPEAGARDQRFTPKSTRRFHFHADSSCPATAGFDSPKLTVLSRDDGTPRSTRYLFTEAARRSPRARLYSSLPRSSQFPWSVTTPRSGCSWIALASDLQIRRVGPRESWPCRSRSRSYSVR